MSAGCSITDRSQAGRTVPYRIGLSAVLWISIPAAASIVAPQRRKKDHMQVCTLLQADTHAITPPLSFYRRDALPAAQSTVLKH